MIEGNLFFNIEREVKICFLNTCRHINVGISRGEFNAMLITVDTEYCCIPIHPLWQSNRIAYSSLKIMRILDGMLSYKNKPLCQPM